MKDKMSIAEAIKLLNMKNWPIPIIRKEAWQVVKETVRKYLKHDNYCRWFASKDCNCGLDTILKLLED